MQGVVSLGTGLKLWGFIQGGRAITDPSTFYLKCEIENMYLLTGQSNNFQHQNPAEKKLCISVPAHCAKNETGNELGCVV